MRPACLVMFLHRHSLPQFPWAFMTLMLVRSVHPLYYQRSLLLNLWCFLRIGQWLCPLARLLGSPEPVSGPHGSGLLLGLTAQSGTLMSKSESCPRPRMGLVSELSEEAAQAPQPQLCHVWDENRPWSCPHLYPVRVQVGVPLTQDCAEPDISPAAATSASFGSFSRHCLQLRSRMSLWPD